METSSLTYRISHINTVFTSVLFYELLNHVRGSHPTFCHLLSAQSSSTVYHEKIIAARPVNNPPAFAEHEGSLGPRSSLIAHLCALSCAT